MRFDCEYFLRREIWFRCTPPTLFSFPLYHWVEKPFVTGAKVTASQHFNARKSFRSPKKTWKKMSTLNVEKRCWISPTKSVRKLNSFSYYTAIFEWLGISIRVGKWVCVCDWFKSAYLYVYICKWIPLWCMSGCVCICAFIAYTQSVRLSNCHTSISHLIELSSFR